MNNTPFSRERQLISRRLDIDVADNTVASLWVVVEVLHDPLCGRSRADDQHSVDANAACPQTRAQPARQHALGCQQGNHQHPGIEEDQSGGREAH